MVNRKPLLSGGGENKTANIDEQIKSVEKLVASAAGLQPSRGDKATVVAVDFAGGNDFEPVPTSATIWDKIAGQSGNYLIATAILLSTILFISLGLRPSLRLILEGKKAGEAAAQLAAEAALISLPAADGEAAQATAIATQEAAKALPPLKLVEQAISENEEQAAEILRQWIRENN